MDTLNKTLATICLTGTLLLAGCGGDGIDRGKLGTLTGKVTCEGIELSDGTILLTNDNGSAGASQIEVDGTFTITTQHGGIPVGTYTVYFQPPMKEVSQGPDSPPAMEVMEMPNMPEKFRSETTSGLTVDIQEGENTKDFDLTP